MRASSHPLRGGRNVGARPPARAPARLAARPPRCPARSLAQRAFARACAYTHGSALAYLYIYICILSIDEYLRFLGCLGRLDTRWQFWSVHLLARALARAPVRARLRAPRPGVRVFFRDLTSIGVSLGKRRGGELAG